MKTARIFAFVAGLLLLVGCSKPSVPANGAAPVHVIDLGVIEVLADTPKHLNLEGEDCTLTASPYLSGQLHIVVESKQMTADGKTGVRTNKSWSSSQIVPSGVEYTGYVGPKLVCFTLKLKAS